MRMLASSALAPIMRHGDRYPGRGTYGSLSYGKTSAVLGQLQSLLGDEVFFSAIRQYAADWAYKHPYPVDLFRTFNRVSGRNLDWYFRTWFYETWSLDQAVKSVTKTESGTQIVIEDMGLASWPTEVEITYAAEKKETRRIEIEHWLSGKKTKSLDVGPDVVKVVIDPKGLTLDSQK